VLYFNSAHACQKIDITLAYALIIRVSRVIFFCPNNTSPGAQLVFPQPTLIDTNGIPEVERGLLSLQCAIYMLYLALNRRYLYSASITNFKEKNLAVFLLPFLEKNRVVSWQFFFIFLIFT
jgi:hypothetical protein